MKFKVNRNQGNLNYHKKYPKNEIETARKLAKRLYKEMSDFIVAMSLFGSSARGSHKKHDIDILVIIDDVHVKLTRELIETYRIILAKAVADIDPKRLHIQTMAWTSFWEYVRAGDPIAINILRDSISLIDIGFFDPLQTLLFQGRIRPSEESIWTYFALAPTSLNSAKSHLNAAMLDLYWAAIDAAHAALMSIGEIPPSPAHVSDMIKKKLVVPGLAPASSATVMQHMFILSKQIMHGTYTHLEGEDYDKYRRHVEKFIKQMQNVITKKKI
jgi:predicted nucleotidyltransferase